MNFWHGSTIIAEMYVPTHKFESVGNKEECEASTDEATRMPTDEATRLPTKNLTWAEVVRGKKR